MTEGSPFAPCFYLRLRNKHCSLPLQELYFYLPEYEKTDKKQTNGHSYGVGLVREIVEPH